MAGKARCVLLLGGRDPMPISGLGTEKQRLGRSAGDGRRYRSMTANDSAIGTAAAGAHGARFGSGAGQLNRLEVL
jgi:hypothetical protein